MFFLRERTSENVATALKWHEDMQLFSQYSRGCIKHIYIAVSIGVFVCETGEVICYPWLPVKIYEHKNRKIYSSIVQCNIYKYINLMGKL